MSLKDKEKWDSKYINKPILLEPREASINLKKILSTCRGNKALDLACGAGKNSIYLAQNYMHVDALDIAKVALDTLNEYAKENGLYEFINTMHVDLDYFTFEDDKYDLILMMNYLDRDIIKKAKASLHVGGIFIVETYMFDHENEKTKSKPLNLLDADELKSIFFDFEIIYYDEFKNENYEIYEMKKQVIVARKLS